MPFGYAKWYNNFQALASSAKAVQELVETMKLN